MKVVAANTGSLRLRQPSLNGSWVAAWQQAVCKLQDIQKPDTAQLWVDGVDIGVGQEVVCTSDYQVANSTTSPASEQVPLQAYFSATAGQLGQQVVEWAQTTVVVVADPQSAAAIHASVDVSTCTLPTSAGAHTLKRMQALENAVLMLTASPARVLCCLCNLRLQHVPPTIANRLLDQSPQACTPCQA